MGEKFEITEANVRDIIAKAYTRLDTAAQDTVCYEVCNALENIEASGTEVTGKMARYIAGSVINAYYSAVDRLRREVSMNMNAVLGL